MANIRPEFYYHPAVGVLAPASIALFQFTPKAPLDPSAERPAPARIPPAPPSPPAPKADLEKLETCIVTGERRPPEEMIRFVIGPEDTVYPDLSGRLPGPAYWVTAKRDVLKKAVWRNSFTTAARHPVNVLRNLPEIVENGLLKLSLETIGLAKKSGLLTHGFAKVEDVLRQGAARVYVVARDGKENGREKLEKLAAGALVLDLWESSLLSAALGEDNVVHAVLGEGPLTDKLITIAQKLKDVR